MTFVISPIFKRFFILIYIAIVTISFTSIHAEAIGSHPSVKTESASGVVSEGFFRHPAPGSNFSREIEHNHDALDVWGPIGTPILASASGTVLRSQTSLTDTGGYGYYVLLEHSYQGRPLHTLYAHLVEPPIVSEGEEVSQGQVIGYMGSTGISTGSHLHFTIFSNLVWNRTSNPHPSCQKWLGSLASTCLSPLSPPINILSHYPTVENFRDVPPEHVFAEQIQTLYAKEINGFFLNQQGEFEPDKPATKAETAQLIAKGFFNQRTMQSTCENFDDITPKHRYYAAIDITSCFRLFGSNSGQFEPGKAITYAELSEVLVRTMRQFEDEKPIFDTHITHTQFNDLDRSHPQYFYIQRALEVDLIQGYEQDNTFRPDETVTRGHLNAITLKAMEMIEQNK